MVHRLSIGLTGLACVLALSMGTKLRADDAMNWIQLPPLPNEEGVAGPFAGTDGGALIVAGGANFPDKMPWEGGKKVWYDEVFLLQSAQEKWKLAGRLPRPLGYGVSISTSDGVVCIGGSDATQHYSDCFRLRWQAGELVISPLASLPTTCANSCGALWGDKIYLAGGLERPNDTSPLKTFWSLDLSNPDAAWQQLETWPGPARMLAVAAVQNGKFFLCSGVDLKLGVDGKPAREYLRDAYSFQPGTGWLKIADMPRAAVAAPTPAPSVGKTKFWIISGDDGTLVDFRPPEQHPGFPKSILAYDTTSGTWQSQYGVPVGHVTTTLVDWRGRMVMPSGEVRPGKRSPAIWSLEHRR